MTTSRTRTTGRRRTAIIGGTAVAAILLGGAAPAQAAGEDAIAPQAGTYGFYVDTYRDNTSALTTPETNPSIGLLSQMLEYWQPGPTWNTGTALVPEVLDANIDRSIEITQTRTDEEATQAYLIDRRNQNYSAIDGLGVYADAFRTASNAGTTIPDTIPADATTTKYDDAGNSSGTWADTVSEVGAVVSLVNTIRGNYATSNNAKNYYGYPRPFRWSDEVEVLPTLEPVKKPVEEAAGDNGYPSGHTNAGYLASYALAYAFPEQYADLLANASDIGNSRIVAGMHSPADVIGGRILATAIAASVLNDPANAALLGEARTEALALLASSATTADDDSTSALDEDDVIARLTYGLPRTGDTTLPVVVPKGAEVLLETRMPYLTDEQRRWVLQSTGLGSGYALLDDAEGWGRLNLALAVQGYGAFDTDVIADMDASDGGFSAADTWSNDIEGDGSLTKQGSGVLTLAGDNAYLGGTTVTGGTLVAASPSALGDGSVTTDGGELEDAVDGTIAISGDFVQSTSSTLSLTLEDTAALAITGEAAFGGALSVSVADGATPADDVVLATYGSLTTAGRFSSVDISGLPAGYEPELEYRAGALHLVNAAAEGAEPQPGDGDGGGEPGTGTPGTGTPGAGDGGSDAGTGAGDPEAGDDLAVTGAADLTPAMLAAATLLLGGALALLLVRRRRRGDA